MSINKVILVGHLTKEPDYKIAESNGNTVAIFTLATNENWTDKQTGEKKSDSQFHRVVVFGKLAEICQKLHLDTGSQLYVEGQLIHRSYVDNQGVTKYITEVKLSGFNSALQSLDRKGEMLGEREIGERDEPKPTNLDVAPEKKITPVAKEEFEDDIPF